MAQQLGLLWFWAETIHSGCKLCICGRYRCWSWKSNPLVTWCEELTHWKRPWCWERLRAGGEGDNRGWDDWMVSLTQWTWVWVSSGVGDGQGGLACCGSWGCKESDTTERLNWTDRVDWHNEDSWMWSLSSRCWQSVDGKSRTSNKTLKEVNV